MPLERPGAGEQLRTGLTRVIVLDLAPEALAVATGQLGLGVEQVDMAGAPLHKQCDHGPGPGRGGWRLWLQGINGTPESGLRGRGPCAFLVQQPGQRQGADAHTLAGQEMAPRGTTPLFVPHGPNSHSNRGRGTHWS